MSETISKLKDDVYISHDEYDEEQAKIDDEEQAKIDQEEYYRHMEDEMEDEMHDTLDSYLKYLDAAYDVKTETLEKHSGDIYNAIQIVTEHDQHLFGFLIAGCSTLGHVIPDLNRDLESSIFLSIHANYRAANILLRRWLETTIIAIYYDSTLKIHGGRKNGGKYKGTLKNLDKWLKTAFQEPFTKDTGTLAKLLKGDANDRATELLNIINPSYEKSFHEYVKTIYSELSHYVHYGGGSSIPNDEMGVNFVEYDEKCFTRWYTKLDQINDLCHILIFLKYPEIIRLSEENEDDWLMSFPTLRCAQVSKLKEWQKSNASVATS